MLLPLGLICLYVSASFSLCKVQNQKAQGKEKVKSVSVGLKEIMMLILIEFYGSKCLGLLLRVCYSPARPAFERWISEASPERLWSNAQKWVRLPGDRKIRLKEYQGTLAADEQPKTYDVWKPSKQRISRRRHCTLFYKDDH